MALIVRGQRKGAVVRIHQIAGETAVIDHGATVLKLGMIELAPIERIRYHDALQSGNAFKRYDEEHFKQTGRFKAINWHK